MQQILENLYLEPGSSSSPPGVAYQADHRGHAVRLSVAGELDISTVDSLTHVAIGALRLPVRLLILDFHGVTFCGAAGVRALIQIQQAAVETGSGLALTGIQPQVGRVLDVVGLSSAFPIPAGNGPAHRTPFVRSPGSGRVVDRREAANPPARSRYRLADLAARPIVSVFTQVREPGRAVPCAS